MKKSLLLLLTIALFQTLIAQDKRPERLDSLFTALYAKKQFNGNVLVADKGEVIFKKSYGIANEETQQKINNNTIFELASVSKQFTAMGIVTLQKAGKLDYDDKISKYIPELDFYGDVTVRNLLNHTGGLPDYMGLFQQKWDKSKFATNEDIVKLVAEHRPEANFQPGEKFQYSNTGYALLASIIERASGKSFTDHLAETNFKPLGMTNTFVYRSRYEPRDIDNIALGYIADNSGNKVRPEHFGNQIPFYYLDGIVGDGMVNSTLDDLLKWDRALYTDKLVNDADKAQIFNEADTKDGKGSGYGFGWGVGKSEKYGRIANHSGSWAGNLTFIERQLDNDKTFIILQNNDTGLNVVPSKEVRKILNNEPLEIKKTINLTAEELEKYTGIFSNENFPIKIEFFVKDGVLMGQGDGQGAFPLDNYANHTFKFDPARISLVFNLEDDTIDFTQGGQSFVFKKEK
ncbi:CubicO group peptidase (beta-lactamase class C family) [Winogradskyella wandonensis]|uniref:CubicO group peptidase (Beta-lactamase class C family) n=1 Tax=Winogradskyella wandonensis TaxID=1442586 RepID=A0A4R1KV20_9FLAO|nr:serine hydrolase domain-containing protein [Winogradskyella wandonensis]TCK69022.1 CubicO group peptidase (beta-lactamase class C family) [Winogradskyella wandonensis]